MSDSKRRLCPPGSTGGRPRRDEALEGLRGLCALLVFYGHLNLPVVRVDPGYDPPSFLSWFEMRSAAVLIFFVLSGYVIGLTTTQTATAANAATYLRKRFWRIFPIPALVILLCWALDTSTAWQTVLGNILALDNDALSGSRMNALLPNDPVLWSVHYEAVFYLAFLAIWFGRPRVEWIVAGCLGLALAGWLVGGCPPWIPRYACGFLYWVAGLSIAWMLPKEAAPHPNRWFAAFLVLYATWMVAPLRTFGIFYDLSYLSLAPVSVHRLDFLPVCVWLILALSKRTFSAQKWLEWGCWMFAASALVTELFTKTLCSVPCLWISGLSLAVAGLSMLTARSIEPRLLALLAPMGRISFGFYVVAWPVQFALLRLLPLPEGTALSYLLRCTVSLSLSLAIAWLLESQFQSWIFAKGSHPGGRVLRR